MEQRSASGLSLKRGPSADGSAAGGASPKREKLQHDPRPSHSGARDTAAGSAGMARSTSVGSAAAAGVTPERSASRTPSTTVGPGGAAVSDKLALKQHATLRKHVLIADPSLAAEDKLLEKVMAVMKDTWSWDELKKFILRKADMKENVEATVDLIRDDMDDEDDEEPTDGTAAGLSSEEGEIVETAAVVQPAQAPLEVKREPPPASDVDVANGTNGGGAPPPPAATISARAPTSAAAAPGTATAAAVPQASAQPVAVQQHQQQQHQHAAAPAQPPSADASVQAPKKKPSKNLPAEERERLARERVLAQGKVWIEPAKKKAMTALRPESDGQVQRGEFREFGAQDENGRRYFSIRQVSDLRVKERCAVVAVVLACEMRPASRSDPLAVLKLQDPTGLITLNAFAKQRSQLPNPAPGSIIFIHNIYLDPWQGNPTIVGSAMDGYDWFYTDLKVTATTCPPRLSAQFGSLDLLSASQHAYAQKLGSWASSSLGLQQADPAVPGAEVAVVEVPAGLVKKGRRRMVIEELTETTEFFDLVAQIVKVGPFSNDSRDLFVTDFSQNPLLFKHDLRVPPIADAQKPKEPFGRFCLKVSLFNELAIAENSSLAVGKIVKLRNAKVRRREFLEASLWGNRDSGCRIERVGLADDGAPELVERRAAFAQELYAEAGEAVPRPTGLEEASARPHVPSPAPWEKPDYPTRAVMEVQQGMTQSCFGQVISVSRPFAAGTGKDKQLYRSIRITDFTAHPAIKDEPDKDPGSLVDPPKEPFGRYALRILLTGDLAENPRGDAFKTGDYVFVSCLRVNDKGGRGLEAYLLQDPAADYPIVRVNPPCGALGPLLKQKNEFYTRTLITCTSPIVHAAEGDDDDDVQQLSEDHMDLDAILAPLKETSPGPAAPDRFSLLQDAPVASVIDGIFQLVKVHTYVPGKTFLTVTDWTAHELVTERHPPLPDPDVVNVEEPFGRFVLEVQVVNPTLQADRAFLEALAPGAVLRLRGLRLVRAPSVGLRGHLLQTDGSSWERMREDSQDGQVLELQGRRAAIYRLSATQEVAPVEDAIIQLESSSPRAVEEPAVADTIVLDDQSGQSQQSDQSDEEMETQAAVLVPDGPSPTRSFYTEGDAGPEPTALEDLALFPARYTVRARVVDFLPKTLEDVVVCICRSCSVILPTEDRVCRSCMSQHDASLGRDLDWTYRIMLKLDDGSDSLWAALFQDDFTALFPSLPPASDFCDSATQIIDRLSAQLALLHPSLGEAAAAEGAQLAGPVLELGIESFEVRNLKGVGAEGATAYKVFQTVLRGQGEAL